MPTLVQGIYWFPGSITYQLGNILTVYLLINVFNLMNSNCVYTRPEKISAYILIFIICGLNETSMVALDLLLGFLFLYDLSIKRKVNRSLLFYVLFTFLCSVIVLTAPGNATRDLGFPDANKHLFLYTVSSGFAASCSHIANWISFPSTIISSVFIILFGLIIVPDSPSKAKKKALFSLLLLLSGFLILIACFLPGFWSGGHISPSRTINVNYWFFILFWFSFLISLSRLIKPLFRSIERFSLSPLILVCFCALLFFNRSFDNYSTAVADLVKGKAYIYNDEYKERLQIMDKCKDSVCKLPAFSVDPRSIFNDDIKSDPSNWWNTVFANYYGQKGVSVLSKNFSSTATYLFTFEDDKNKLLKNVESVTNVQSFSPPCSSLLPGQDTYSAIFSTEINKLEISVSEINKVSLSLALYSTDSIIDAAIAVSINKPGSPENILWKAKELRSSSYRKNQWGKESCEIDIEPQVLDPKNTINFFVWNRGKGKIYVDDLQISFK
jgi:hypothetical protein